jgi:hypothetical protein
MLVANRPSLLLDYFRVPYEVREDGGDWGVLTNGAGRLIWPSPAIATGRRGLWRVGDTAVYATLAASDAVAGRRGSAAGWSAVADVADAEGSTVATIETHSDGTVLLPFDPGDAMISCWSEAYAENAPARGLKRLAMRSYYAVRPALPRSLQLQMRRGFSRIQARVAFPRWPVEPGLHDLYELLFRLIADAFGEPVPAIGPWPRGKQWALVLTHDVEHAEGYDAIPLMRAIEERMGYRSAWYLVPERDYAVDDAVVADLQTHGFEVGVHGLHHDGRDLAHGHFHERLPAVRAWGERWHARGFRSPATHRDWELMPQLPFDYDTSSFDTDPFEPQSGGCCTWLPFENRSIVELPLTMTMDHTVFVILRRGADLWRAKADALRARGGMAMLLTHPDYMREQERLDAYEQFLERYADDETAWRALPQEVAAWWRRRAASSLVRGPSGEYAVDGPAAEEAEVVLLGG